MSGLQAWRAQRYLLTIRSPLADLTEAQLEEVWEAFRISAAEEGDPIIAELIEDAIADRVPSVSEVRAHLATVDGALSDALASLDTLREAIERASDAKQQADNWADECEDAVA